MGKHEHPVATNMKVNNAVLLGQMSIEIIVQVAYRSILLKSGMNVIVINVGRGRRKKGWNFDRIILKFTKNIKMFYVLNLNLFSCQTPGARKSVCPMKILNSQVTFWWGWPAGYWAGHQISPILKSASNFQCSTSRRSETRKKVSKILQKSTALGLSSTNNEW